MGCDREFFSDSKHGFQIWKPEKELLPATGNKHVDLKHILSHQRLYARFSKQSVDTLPDIPGTRRVALRELDDYGLSRLTLIALEKLL